jgi:NAD(P)-dependent dehydrogenase (short-subunit alcohol dehydrogenase family)
VGFSFECQQRLFLVFLLILGVPLIKTGTKNTAYKDRMNFMERTYVVTGAASEIGAATSAMLKAAGHKVIGVDIHNTDVTADLSTALGRHQAAQDVINKADSSIDAVIACAGLGTPTTKTVSVNYFGVTEFLFALLPTLSLSKSPRVAITSSMASLMPNSVELVDAMCIDNEEKAIEVAQGLVNTGGGSEQLIYGSTKRAISRWVRRECIKPKWAGAGIALNAVGPGIVKTPMTAGLIATPEAVDSMAKIVPMPLNGFMAPEAVASLLIWLTSPENTHTTGQTIYIDGGSDAALRGEKTSGI